MFGFGGMPFGFGGFPDDFGPSPSRATSNDTRYYDILGVTKNASLKDITKAYRRLALRHHPDQGGDAEKIKEINEAYDVLKDEEKRRLYDMYGEEGVKNGGPTSTGDLFRDLFNVRSSRMSQPRKAKDVTHKLTCTLEELYNGNTRRMSLARNSPCAACNGSGARSGRKSVCQNCRGRGMETRVHQLAPGMIQQVTQQCKECGGSGSAIAPGDVCRQCMGHAIVEERKVFEVVIEPGMVNGARIRKHGEAGSPDPALMPGDLVFVINEAKHAVFKRAGWDLILQRQITLKEALCGTECVITTLDRRTISIRSAPGEVIKPSTWKCVAEEGMPIHGNPTMRGNLYIQFDVVFPDVVDPVFAAQMAQLLPGPAIAPQQVSGGDVHMEQLTWSTIGDTSDMQDELGQRRKMARAHGVAADQSDSDDDMRHPQGIACAQQ